MTTSTKHRVVGALAGLLGLVTIVAGARVLAGGDPGYPVVRPVLLFNTVMGTVYLLAAVLIARASPRARGLAWFIAEANAVVLLGVVVMRLVQHPVAAQTLVAMAFRTAAWFAIAAFTKRPFLSSRGSGSFCHPEGA